MAQMRLMLLLLLLSSLNLVASDFFSEPAYMARLKKKASAPPVPPASWSPSNLTALVSWWNPDTAVTNSSGNVSNVIDIISGRNVTNIAGSATQPYLVEKNGRKIIGMPENNRVLRNQSFLEPANNMSMIFILCITNRFNVQYILGTNPSGNSRKSGVNLQCGTSGAIPSYNQTNKLCVIAHVKWFDTLWRESLMTNGVIGSTVTPAASFFSNVCFMNVAAANAGTAGLLGDFFFIRTNANAASMAGDMSNLYVWATNKYGVF